MESVIEHAASTKTDRTALVQLLNNIRGVNVDATNGWTNYSGTIDGRNSIVVQVHNTSQLQNVLVAIDHFNETSLAKVSVRAVAGWNDQHRYPSFLSCLSHEGLEEKYNESFSWSHASLGDVIIRFSHKFHSISKIYKIENDDCVDVSAGVQICDLNVALEKKGYGLETAPMIRYVSAVGLFLTSGHGTGQNKGGFAGYVKSITMYDYKGIVRTINVDDPDFKDICGSHLGLFGIVTSITLKVTNQMMLHEKRTSYHTVTELIGANGANLISALLDNDYFTLLHMPSYLKDEQLSAEHFPWQLRSSDTTAPNAEQTPEDQLHPETWSKLASEELTTNLGGTFLEAVVAHPALTPAFMKFGATVEFGKSGETKHFVGPRSIIAHEVSAFPHAMDDVTFVFPVKNNELQSVAHHLLKIDELLKEFAEKKQYPLTFMFYLRYIQGTNGGLSFTCHGEGERVLAFDFVSHPHAPGWAEFKLALFNYFSSQNLKLKYHLGKVLPDPTLTYRDIYGEEVIENMINLLCRWYKVERPQLARVPFLTPFILKNLGLMPGDVIAENLHAEANRSAEQKKPEIAEAYKALVQDKKVYADKFFHHNEELRQDWVNACHEFTDKVRESEPYVDIALEHSMQNPLH